MTILTALVGIHGGGHRNHLTAHDWLAKVEHGGREGEAGDAGSDRGAHRVVL